MLRFLGSICKSAVCRWVAAVVLVTAVLVLWRPTLTDFLELKLYDLKFLFRGARPPGPEVAIVAIDDDSVKTVGRWPWSREETARLLTSLKAMQPRVIAMDIIFAEKQETGALNTLKQLQQLLSRQGAPAEILKLLEQEKERADVDRRLAAAIKAGPPTILGFFFRSVGGKAGGVKSAQLMEPSFIEAATYNQVRTLDTEPSEVPIIGAAGAEVNLPEIT